jgi:hypothetical protein
VHPAQQLGVVDPVLLPGLGLDAAQAPVDAPHPGTGAPGVLGGAERRHADVVRGPEQPAPRVLAEVAVRGDAGHRQRVQGCSSSARRPASAIDGSPLTRQLTLSGPYSPGSAAASSAGASSSKSAVRTGEELT